MVSDRILLTSITDTLDINCGLRTIPSLDILILYNILY